MWKNLGKGLLVAILSTLAGIGVLWAIEKGFNKKMGEWAAIGITCAVSGVVGAGAFLVAV